MKTAIKTLLDKVDEAKVTQQAMVNVLSRYKRDRVHILTLYRKQLLTEKEYTEKLSDLDLSIATVRVLLNRGAKRV